MIALIQRVSEARVTVEQRTVGSIGRGIRYFGQGYLAVLYGEQAAEFMKTHGAEIGIGLALTAVLIGVAVFFLRKRTHGSAAA